MPSSKAVLVLLLLASGAKGQESSPGMALQRAIEMPAHRALISVVEKADGIPAPFSTDGCSGGLSAGWERAAEVFPGFSRRYKAHPPWEDCCIAHDAIYHRAGGAETPEESFDKRLASDLALQACVIDTGEQKMEVTMAETGLSEPVVRNAFLAIAGAMYNAVRLGGGPCSGLPWRWGYGFSRCFFQ
jgi:hypothetical protein